MSGFIESLSSLTGKEREVLLSFIELLDNKEIAKRLGTKDQTVRNQLASIMRSSAPVIGFRVNMTPAASGVNSRCTTTAMLGRVNRPTRLR